MCIKLQLPTSENKTRHRKFQSTRKYPVQHWKMVSMPHQNQILHSSWLTSQNAAPSIGSLYKLPTLFATFLFCDVIADKVYCLSSANVRTADLGVRPLAELCVNVLKRVWPENNKPYQDIYYDSETVSRPTNELGNQSFQTGSFKVLGDR